MSWMLIVSSDFHLVSLTLPILVFFFEINVLLFVMTMSLLGDTCNHTFFPLLVVVNINNTEEVLGFLTIAMDGLLSLSALRKQN